MWQVVLGACLPMAFLLNFPEILRTEGWGCCSTRDIAQALGSGDFTLPGTARESLHFAQSRTLIHLNFHR